MEMIKTIYKPLSYNSWRWIVSPGDQERDKSSIPAFLLNEELDIIATEIRRGGGVERQVDRKEGVKMLHIFRHITATSVGTGRSKVCMITNDLVHFLDLFFKLCVCVRIYAPVHSANRARVHVRSLEAGVTGACELPDLGVGSRTPVLCRAVGIYNSGSISPAQTRTF